MRWKIAVNHPVDASEIEAVVKTPCDIEVMGEDDFRAYCRFLLPMNSFTFELLSAVGIEHIAAPLEG